MCFSLAPTLPISADCSPVSCNTGCPLESARSGVKILSRASKFSVGDRGRVIVSSLAFMQFSLHARPLIQDLAKRDVDWCSWHSFGQCIAHCGMLIFRRLAVALQWCFELSPGHWRQCGGYARIRSCFARQRNQELARWRAEASVTRRPRRVTCSSCLLCNV